MCPQCLFLGSEGFEIIQLAGPVFDFFYPVGFGAEQPAGRFDSWLGTGFLVRFNVLAFAWNPGHWDWYRRSGHDTHFAPTAPRPALRTTKRRACSRVFQR